MSDLLFARLLMAASLAFHIMFAVVGIGMPLLMALAERLYLRTRDPMYLDLAKRWAKGTAILFAVGAVSGTVLSFELGMLWPGFMAYAGGIIGMPFSLEGLAFFTEAIFLGIYLYGWKRLSPQVHWWCGVAVAISGVMSGVFVVTANAWMNAPAGFELVNGQVVNVDPIAAMLNPASLQQVIHMSLAAYIATGFGVAAVHGWLLLRNRQSIFHRRALGLALALGMATCFLQLVSGHGIARMTSRLQPAKFAAMEGHYRTEAGAALVIGGIPDDEAMTTRYALKIPCALSFLAHHRADGVVTGLEDIPRDQWPNTRIVHWAFDLMVGIGMGLVALSAWAGWLWWRKRRVPDHPWLLCALIVAGPLSFLAIQAGWVVTEVGRQPWIIQGIMRTSEAVTPVKGLAVPFFLFMVLYGLLAAVVVGLLRRQFLETKPRPASPANVGASAAQAGPAPSNPGGGSAP